MYVFVRNDLSVAQKAVQSCHAVIECAKIFDFNSLADHPSVITLSARSEHKLLEFCSYLERIGVKYASFREPDIGHQMTAIATEPIFENKRLHFKKFQLLNSQGGVK